MRRAAPGRTREVAHQGPLAALTRGRIRRISPRVDQLRHVGRSEEDRLSELRARDGLTQAIAKELTVLLERLGGRSEAVSPRHELVERKQRRPDREEARMPKLAI